MLFMGSGSGREDCMVNSQQYRAIRDQIYALIRESDSSIDPPELLARLRQEGIPREVASTIMWEMIAAGYISRSKDWLLSPEREPTQELEMHA
jgi:hypothetical protein